MVPSTSVPNRNSVLCVLATCGQTYTKLLFSLSRYLAKERENLINAVIRLFFAMALGDIGASHL